MQASLLSPSGGRTLTSTRYCEISDTAISETKTESIFIVLSNSFFSNKIALSYSFGLLKYLLYFSQFFASYFEHPFPLKGRFIFDHTRISIMN